jgi:hypothetical protein
MTEHEWLTSQDPDHLLKWLQRSKRHRPTRRKLGLFACACAGRLGERVRDEFTLRGLALAGRMAEGASDRGELRAFHAETTRAGLKSDYGHIAVWAVRVLEEDVNWSSPEGSARSVAGYTAEVLGPDEPAHQCRLLRDVIGNPFRRRPPLPPAVLAWNKGTVTKLARGIYDEGAFDRLPVLADALLDAGCDDEEPMGHLRGPGPHVRGCWAVDSLLERR